MLHTFRSRARTRAPLLPHRHGGISFSFHDRTRHSPRLSIPSEAPCGIRVAPQSLHYCTRTVVIIIFAIVVVAVLASVVHLRRPPVQASVRHATEPLKNFSEPLARFHEEITQNYFFSRGSMTRPKKNKIRH